MFPQKYIHALIRVVARMSTSRHHQTVQGFVASFSSVFVLRLFHQTSGFVYENNT